jgi:hypothetical protein
VNITLPGDATMDGYLAAENLSQAVEKLAYELDGHVFDDPIWTYVDDDRLKNYKITITISEV